MSTTMQQAQLWQDTIYDAIGPSVQAAGGVKAVAARLWPTLEVSSASARLRSALNPEHAQKLNPEELLLLVRLAKSAGDTSVIGLFAREVGFDRKSRSRNATVNLDQLGIDKSESARFQQVAAIPQRKFEAHLAQARESQQPVTAASLRALTRQPDFTPAQRTEHERLWRVLRALEQIAGQDITAAQWLAQLPDYMAKQAAEHMGKARPWLEALFTEWEKKHAN